MDRWRWFVCWVVMCGCACVAAPAAGLVCGHAVDAVEQKLCADPALVALDARLAHVYADALARDPAQAGALRQDQRNWLAGRDEYAVEWFRPPATGGQANGALARSYQRRIAFLRSLDRAAATRASPVARTLLAALPGLPVRDGDVLAALQAAGRMTMAPVRYFTGVADLVAALPAPPRPALRRALQRFAGTSYTKFEYLPSARLGAVHNLVDSPQGFLCDYWVVFTLQDGATHAVPGERAGAGKCWVSPGTGRLASVDGHPLVIVQMALDPSTGATLDWWRWLGRGWGPRVTLRVRFGHVVEVHAAACAPALDCAAVRRRALQYARRYDARPRASTLDDPAGMAAGERLDFVRMRSRAEAMQAAPVAAAASGPFGRLPLIDAESLQCTPGFGPDAAWFPAVLGGSAVLGRIGRCPDSWHGDTRWMAGFWQSGARGAVPLAGLVFRRHSSHVLVAARMAPDQALAGP